MPASPEAILMLLLNHEHNKCEPLLLLVSRRHGAPTPAQASLSAGAGPEGMQVGVGGGAALLARASIWLLAVCCACPARAVVEGGGMRGLFAKH